MLDINTRKPFDYFQTGGDCYSEARIGLWDVRKPGKVVVEYEVMADRQQTSM